MQYLTFKLNPTVVKIVIMMTDDKCGYFTYQAFYVEHFYLNFDTKGKEINNWLLL